MSTPRNPCCYNISSSFCSTTIPCGTHAAPSAEVAIHLPLRPRPGIAVAAVAAPAIALPTTVSSNFAASAVEALAAVVVPAVNAPVAAQTVAKGDAGRNKLCCGVVCLVGLHRLLYTITSYSRVWGGCGISEPGLVLLCERLREGMKGFGNSCFRAQWRGWRGKSYGRP